MTPSEPTLPEDDPGAQPDAAARERAALTDAAREPATSGVLPLPQRVVVPRWIQLVLLPIGLLAIWALVRAASSVVLVFMVASVVALILNPLVTLVHRGRVPRGVAVFAVYIGFFVVLAGVGALLANPVTHQIESFQRDVPALTRSANRSLAKVQRWFDERNINVHIKDQGQTALKTLQRNVLKRSGDLLAFTSDLLARIAAAAFALVLILVISVYMLLYGPRIGRQVRALMPRGDGTPADDYPLRVQKAVSGYVRGQALFSLIMGFSAGLALYVFGVLGIFPDGRTYALFFGAFFGVMELIPYIGPVLGAIPPILVALLNDPLTAVWVALLFLALQQLEGHVVAPQVFGHSLRINPLLVIFALLLGAELYGIVGAFIALPIAAVLRETVLYLHRHLVLEPWSTPSAAQLAPPPADVRGEREPPDPER